MTGTQSAFGEQFDSMSDLLSFGAAPAFLFYFRFLADFGRPGVGAAFVFVLCGALRLARFNANIDKVDSNYFQGLPIPAAAIAMIGLVLLSIQFEALLSIKFLGLPYIIVYAILMITSIPFPSFKKSEFVQNHRKATLLIIFAIMASIFFHEKIMLFVWLSAYTAGSLAHYILKRDQLGDVFQLKDEE